MSLGREETQSQKEEEAELKRQEAQRKAQQAQIQRQAIASIKRRAGLGPFGGSPSTSLLNPPGTTLG